MALALRSREGGFQGLTPCISEDRLEAGLVLGYRNLCVLSPWGAAVGCEVCPVVHSSAPVVSKCLCRFGQFLKPTYACDAGCDQGTRKVSVGYLSVA